MDLTVQQAGPVTIVSVVGSFDAMTAPDVEACLHSQLGLGQCLLVLDLGLTDYMGSVGLRVMLTIQRLARQKGGDLRLAAPQPGVAKVLRLSGAGDVMGIFPSTDEAATSYATSPAA